MPENAIRFIKLFSVDRINLAEFQEKENSELHIRFHA